MNVFKRKEKKYLISEDTAKQLQKAIEVYIRPDDFGESQVTSVYYDDENFSLIQRSIEKPPYKEKFRVRSYKRADEKTRVFAEIKKKYKGIVYKRRVSASYKEIKAFLDGQLCLDDSLQIQNEILWMVKRYNLKPKIWISYKRSAYFAKENSNLRISFDHSLRYNLENPDLSYGNEGKPIISEDLWIMEIKSKEGLPPWLNKELSQRKIYPHSFSKVGEAFKKAFLQKEIAI